MLLAAAMTMLTLTVVCSFFIVWQVTPAGEVCLAWHGDSCAAADGHLHAMMPEMAVVALPCGTNRNGLYNCVAVLDHDRHLLLPRSGLQCTLVVTSGGVPHALPWVPICCRSVDASVSEPRNLPD